MSCLALGQRLRPYLSRAVFRPGRRVLDCQRGNPIGEGLKEQAAVFVADMIADGGCCPR